MFRFSHLLFFHFILSDFVVWLGCDRSEMGMLYYWAKVVGIFNLCDCLCHVCKFIKNAPHIACVTSIAVENTVILHPSIFLQSVDVIVMRCAIFSRKELFNRLTHFGCRFGILLLLCIMQSAPCTITWWAVVLWFVFLKKMLYLIWISEVCHFGPSDIYIT